MRFLCFLVLVGLSTASFEQRESNASVANITSQTCKTTTTTTTVTSALSAADATSSRPLLFPTSPSLRLPLPYWDNRTNATRNFSAPTAPSIPFSATSSWRDDAREMLMYKALLVMAISMLPAALML